MNHLTCNAFATPQDIVSSFLAARRYADAANPEQAATQLAVCRYGELLSRARESLDGQFSLDDIEKLLALTQPSMYETHEAMSMATTLADECGWESFSDVAPGMMDLARKLVALTPLQSCALADALERLVYVQLIPGRERTFAKAANAAGLLLQDDVPRS